MPDPGRRPTDTAVQVLLEEYKELKAEQRQRIGFRDNFLYATFGVAAAVVLGIKSIDASVALLLALPPAVLVLGWTYLANDVMVTQLGAYMRQQVAPRLTELSGVPALRWEWYRPGEGARRVRKRIQFAVDLGTFCGTSAAALVAFWALAPWHPPLFAVSLAEAAAVGVLTWQITRYRPTQTGDQDV